MNDYKLRADLVRKNVPEELKDTPTWVCWRYEDRGGRMTKVPYQPHGANAKSNDPSTWHSLEECLRAAEHGRFSGVGIVLIDDLVGYDLDHISAHNELADELIDQFIMAGAYVEFSPSGDGVRAITRGALPRAGKGTAHKWIEAYDRTSPRYLTITGNAMNLLEQLHDGQQLIEQMHDRFFQKKDNGIVVQMPTATAPKSLADSEILEKARSSSPEFSRLYSTAPSQNDDHSSLDLALCNMLAFWCGRDTAQMDRIFRSSALMREKWDKRSYSDGRTYGEATLEKAASECSEVYSGKIGHAPLSKVESLSETTPSRIEVAVGDRTFEFGKRCVLRTEKKRDGEFVPVSIPFARSVWPTEKYRQVEDGEFGVRYRFQDHAGKTRHAIMPHGASVDSAAASRASSAAASAGVQVAPESKGLLAQALGYWAQQATRTISLVRTPGWHEGATVYVNGPTIAGAERWEADENALAIARRSGRKGSASAWSSAGDLFNTSGLRAALGLSLAGALVGMLDVVPFGIHICGNSSHGKSTTARLASAVWGDPDRMLQSWDSTLRALEGLTDAADGACLVLDEVKRFRGDASALSAAIHSLCSQQGRARLGADGQLQEQRRWENTVLSTGEVRMRDLLGEHYQGGHRVRMIDVWVESGDLTTSADHARRIDKFCQSNHGMLSDAWISIVTRAGADEIRRLWESMVPQEDGATQERQRILANLTLICVALELARRSELIQIKESDVANTLTWLTSASGQDESEEEDSPNARALALLRQWTETQPYRFPFSTNHSTGRDVVAYKVLVSNPESADVEFELWATEPMLRGSGLDRLAGVNIRNWIGWLKDVGVATDMGRERLSGMRRRWLKIDLEKSESGTEFEVGQKAVPANLF